jgi:hypothetical protein
VEVPWQSQQRAKDRRSRFRRGSSSGPPWSGDRISKVAGRSGSRYHGETRPNWGQSYETGATKKALPHGVRKGVITLVVLGFSILRCEALKVKCFPVVQRIFCIFFLRQARARP